MMFYEQFDGFSARVTRLNLLIGSLYLCFHII